MEPGEQPTIIKRGRKKFSADLDAFLKDTRSVCFAPSYMVREHMAYCMRETGVYNKSQIVALAMKNYNDMLFAEAKRRQEIEDNDAFKTINPSNFNPTKK